MIDYPAIADRLTQRLRQVGWSRRELARRAWGKDDAKVSNTLASLRAGSEVALSTLTELATALDVSIEWFVYGRGDAPTNTRMIDRSVSDPPAPAEAATTPPPTERERGDLPEGCLATGKNYRARKDTARRIAPDVPEQWVWDDLDTTDTLFLGTREPSPQVLADLARLIQKHGKPR